MVRGQPGQRFTLLLLEEGEDYISDYNAYCRAPGVLWVHQEATATSRSSLGARTRRVHGKLRLCTKSMFFDSGDISVPILRCDGLMVGKAAVV
jgi:hypothetical protein